MDAGLSSGFASERPCRLMRGVRSSFVVEEQDNAAKNKIVPL
jgi:hypothetical protein